MTFDQFLQDACPLVDLAWRKYRRRAARHRVEERIRELRLSGFDEYLERVRSDRCEAERLPDLMLVTVTRFFREEPAWRELREKILPAILSRSESGRCVKMWSAGCCGGEEPYSLAMLWRHYLQPLDPGRQTEILAWDIDDASLARAARGIYRSASLREIPPEMRERWFYREDSLWRVRDEMRALVTFERRNLLADAPPREVDLVLCRYLAFTYFKGDRLLAAVRKLWESLKPGGFLMIGAKESLDARARELFEQVDGSRFFYRRKG